MSASGWASPRSFGIDVRWLPRDGGDPLERVTAAEIGIRLPDGENLTKIEDSFAQTVRGTARLSAHHLASWFATNWWRLRWEPFANTQGWRMSHHLAAAGGGFVWPDIVFDTDGHDVRIAARPTSAATHESIAYLTGGQTLVGAESFEGTIDRFVDTTVARLCATGNDAADLVTLWREVLEERRDPAMTAYRRLEAMSGFDVDEGPEGLIDELLALESELGSSAVEEIAAASGVHALRDIRALVEQGRPHAVQVTVPNALAISVEDRVLSGEEPAWSAGYRLAEIARDAYGLGTEPVLTDTLAHLFDAPDVEAGVPVGIPPIAAAFRTEAGADAIGLVLTAHRPQTRRFEFMRLIGGHLATRSNDVLVPATKAKTARQRLQRAFAAEFLCPIAGLREMFDERSVDADDIDEAAERYGVSPALVNWMLHNRGAMSAPSMRF